MKRIKIVFAALFLAVVMVFGVAGCNVGTGAFYTLQEAYDNGWLTQADLMSIAYYHNGGRTHNEEIMSEDYEPAPKTPEVLSKRTESKIKRAAAKYYRDNYNLKDAKTNSFTITEYNGTFKDCIVVMMVDIFTGYWDVEETHKIAEIRFYYNNSNHMKIWREIK